MITPFRPIGQALTVVWKQALALAIPPTCIACHSTLHAQEPMGFCATCYGHMPWWNPNHILPPQLPAAISSFKAPCLYEAPLRQVLLQFKFSDATILAPHLAKLLLPLMPNEQNLLLIPVPSHPARLRQRLYNHSALLAQALSKLTGHAVNTTALHRLKPSAPQAEKTRAARLKLSGKDFAALPQAVQNQHVVLIDDILTTGATARACALALKRAGAARVSVLTLAYTQPNT